MNIQEILSLSPDQWLTELEVDPITRDIQANLDYFDGVHPVLTDLSRQDYSIPKWEIDEETGQPKINPLTGKKISGSPEQVKRTRLVLNYQKQIVQTAQGLCVGAPVTLTLNSGDEPGHKEAFDILVDQWRNKTRLDTFSLKMTEALFVESKCAELYFHENADVNGDIKVMLLSKKNGDDIWAHFDDNKKMDALTRVYTKRVLVDGEATDVEVTQIWTAKSRLEKIDDGAWEEVKNPYGKLTIVYYDQEKPEFHLVTDLINKQELVRSQNSDVNKRLGNPALVVSGNEIDTPDVDQDVKVFLAKYSDDGQGGKIKAEINYLQVEGAPEAIKMELEGHQEDMYKLSWPDLSFLRKMTVGQLSGTAIKLMFTDAFVKIGIKRGIFEDFSRRVSVMKAMLAKSKGEVFNELNISVQFNSILPENIVELADTLSTARQGGFMSGEDATAAFSLNDGNPDAYQNILDEEARILGGVGE